MASTLPAFLCMASGLLEGIGILSEAFPRGGSSSRGVINRYYVKNDLPKPKYSGGSSKEDIDWAWVGLWVSLVVIAVVCIGLVAVVIYLKLKMARAARAALLAAKGQHADQL